MTSPLPPRPSFSPPSLDELTARFLAGAASSPGLEESSEVELYEVSGGFRPAARALWDEAFVTLRLFGLTPDKLTMPPEWSAFASELTFPNGLPMAAGLCPQQFRTRDGRLPSDHSATASNFSALRNWVRKATRSHSATTLLVAAGIAAVLGERSEAEAALRAAEGLVNGAWQDALQNQRASVLWLSGEKEAAIAIWAAMPMNPVVEFNRGIMARAVGKADEAVQHLQTAGKAIPDTSGWSHLAWVQSMPVTSAG